MQLISLMDVVFILLIFFLVSIFFASLPNEERKLLVPTPKNEEGYAQVLIQLVDDRRFFYVDPSITQGLVNEITQVDRLSGLSRNQKLQRKKEILFRRCLFTASDEEEYRKLLEERISGLLQLANSHPEQNYFVMIRCPDDIEYARVIEIIQMLTGSKFRNIQYGLVGGTLEDIRNSKSIRKQIVEDELGRRRNVIIEF
jgi:biopolymer transport protein ExbD